MAMRTTNVSEKDYSVALPGNYPFKVESVMKDRNSGNATVPAYDFYRLEIDIDCGEQGHRTYSTNLNDTPKAEWKIAKFLISVEACTPDAKGNVQYDPDWCLQMEARTGTVKLWNRSYTARTGELRWVNEVDFLNPASVASLHMGPAEGATLPQAQPAPAQPAAPAPQADGIPF